LSVTSGSNTDSLVMTAPASASHTITVPDETGTICTTAGSAACTGVYAAAGGSGSYIQNGTSVQTANFNIQGSSGTAAAAVIQANNGGSGDVLDLKNGTGGVVASFGNTGSVLFETTTNTTAAFQVQNASSSTVLDVDTTNEFVGIGTAAPNAKLNIVDTAFSDNFNRANNTSLGSNWTKVTDAGTDFQIVSNQLKETSSDNSTSALGAYTTQGITSANYGVQSDIVFPSSSDDWLSVMGRAILNGGSDTNGYYLFASMGNQKVALYKRVGTTWTQLGTSASETIVAGTTYTMKLVMNGTNLYGYWNGALAVSTTDSTYASAGFAGIAVGFPNLANSIWDNFSITSVNPSLNVNNNFAVTANGWVGVGTTSPSYGIDLQSNNSINVTGNYLLNGTSINTAGTLSNVAYLNQANTFTNANIFKDASNSTGAFEVQNSTGSNLLTVDTTNTAIILGNDGTPSAVTVRGGAATGTNATGSNLTFAASNGTGTGGSGDLIFQTAAPSVSTPTDDGNDNTSNASSTTSLTFSHTVTSNANRIIIVGIGTGCGFGGTCAATVSSVTYAGINLTKLGNADCTTGAGHCHVELWYLAGSSVATGANSVVITTSGSTTIKAGASSYYNVDPTTPFGTAATATSNNNPSTLTVTSNTNQLVVDVITSDNVINSASAGQTQRYLGTGPIASSTKPGGASTTSMGWSDGSSNYATIGAGLNPPAGTSSNSLQDRLHITATGNVGINTASPQYALDVAGTGRITSTSNTTTAFQVQNASNSAVLDVDTTNGRVGIGTTAPATNLDVENATANNTGTYALQVKQNNASSLGVYVFANSNSSTIDALNVQGWNGSSVVNALDVKSNGYVGIGTSSP
ncbi:MAG TPA: hypothetical protein VFT53_07145, partial [Candidatus Saccharimonadales bacterium]|nr:hypothetical protein [Candidatus Saccharimonadales bacterium]